MISKNYLNRIIAASILLLTFSVSADTTIDDINRFSWGANFGWMNWRGDVESGVEVFHTHLKGYAYSANVGWINFGDGPEDGISYLNDSADDFGVNLDFESDPNEAFLSGYAWSANTGWINFDIAGIVGSSNRPRIDKFTGVFSGYAWSANMGWINLNSSVNNILSTFIRLITLEDVQYHILGIDLLTGERFNQADANDDGVIDVADLIRLVNLGF